MNPLPTLYRRIGRLCAATLTFVALAISSVVAAVPPAEKLLPQETLLLLTAPDWNTLNELYRKAPQNQLWDDPALKPFRDKFMAKWNDEIVKPLERDLGIKFSDYAAMLQGQITFAVLQEGWEGKKDDGLPAVVLIIDAKDKKDLLKKNLDTLRQKWTTSGKAIKTEKVRDVELSIVTLTTNDIPATIRRLLPQPQEIEEVGGEKEETPTQLVIAQHESVLLVSSAPKAAEKVIVRLAGSGAQSLADVDEFENCRRTVFRDAPWLGWLNTKLLVDLAVKSIAANQNPEAPSPIPMPDFKQIFSAIGLTGLKSVAFSFREAGQGDFAVEFFLSVPESSRNGIFKLLAVEAKDAAPPAFVPADVLKFSRVRLDGRKAIATLEKIISDISPQGASTWDFLINNANEAARIENPDYDIRKDIFENLGDDVITYEKPPQGKSLAELTATPTLVLIASPNADKFAVSLKGLFGLMPTSGGAPKTREFLGRKIFTLNMGGGYSGAESALHYVASGGYVAFSSDEKLIEEYLRSADSEVKPLRSVAGFAEAVDKAGGMTTGWLTYENQAETMRALFAALTKKSSDADGPDFVQVLASALPFAAPEEKIKEWVDFSLLPNYDQLAKYYGFIVAAGQTSVNGITFKYFIPTPAELRKAAAQ